MLKNRHRLVIYSNKGIIYTSICKDVPYELDEEYEILKQKYKGMIEVIYTSLKTTDEIKIEYDV